MRRVLVVMVMGAGMLFGAAPGHAAGGEIRGFFEVPEPDTLTLLALGLGLVGGFIALRNRRR